MSRQLSPMQQAIADHQQQARRESWDRWWANRNAGWHMTAEDRRLNALARLSLFTHGTEHPNERCCGRCIEEEPWEGWGCCCRSLQAGRHD